MFKKKYSKTHKAQKKLQHGSNASSLGSLTRVSGLKQIKKKPKDSVSIYKKRLSSNNKVSRNKFIKLLKDKPKKKKTSKKRKSLSQKQLKSAPSGKKNKRKIITKFENSRKALYYAQKKNRLYWWM